jgi:hypothetical protein
MSDEETNNLRRGLVVGLKRSSGKSNGLIACSHGLYLPVHRRPLCCLASHVGCGSGMQRKTIKRLSIVGRRHGCALVPQIFVAMVSREWLLYALLFITRSL